MTLFDRLVNLIVGRLLAQIRDHLAGSSNTLLSAVAAVTGAQPTPHEVNAMNPILQQLQEQVAATLEVEKSAVVALSGVAARIDAAVAKALENGATAAQLAPVVDEVTALKGSADALAAAIASIPAA